MWERVAKEAIFAARVGAVAAVGFGLYYAGKAITGLFSKDDPEAEKGEGAGEPAAEPAKA